MDSENRTEEVANQPAKTNVGMIVFLLLTIIFFLVAIVLGYLYYQKAKASQTLTTEKERLEEQIASIPELQEQLDQLEAEKEDIAKDEDDLTTSNEDWTAKMESVEAYNSVLAYISNLLRVHGGFESWTNAEYQQGRKLAQATGDTNLVSVVDWAWNNKTISQTTRLRRVIDAVVSGITSTLE